MFNRSPMDFGSSRRNTGLKTVFFVINLIFAIFFINYPFNFFKIPETIMKFENWIIFVGGILILLGAINYMRASKRYL